MKKFIGEFKSFAMKGNVMDLAVGVIIGGAFGKIITSLVDNVIMPIVGIILGGKNFSSLALTVGDAKITYGLFIAAAIDFIIIALVLFAMIKIMNRAMRKKAVEPVPVEKPAEVQLLEEIRDLLKK
jgi:large conductance mechanosensitive channel